MKSEIRQGNAPGSGLKTIQCPQRQAIEQPIAYKIQNNCLFYMKL